MKEKPFILFDFDGVIADSFEVAFSIARKLCVRFTEETYRKSFEENVHDWHEREITNTYHGPKCRHDLDWFAEYIPHFEQKVRPFEGMTSVIEILSHEYVLIIVSSTITSPIQGFLERHHIGRYFSEVMGSDVHTNKTEKIKMIFEKYMTTAGKCVFITDSLGDMNEARNVSVGSIGVTWGWHGLNTLSRGKPFRVVEKPEDLSAAISDYFSRHTYHHVSA